MNKKFLIKNLFNIINNPQLDKENFIFSERAKYPYFTRTENNNGIYGYVKYFDDDHLIPGNSLAVGMISMQFHYMQHDFYAGQFTKTLIPKFRGFNENLAMYFIAILNKHSEYYQSYLVRHFKEKISETVVELPVIEHSDLNYEYTVDDIDWQYMEDRIKELEEDRIKELEAYLKVTNLGDYELTDEDKKVLSLSRKSTPNENGSLETDCEDGTTIGFKKFRIGSLFDIHPTKAYKLKNRELFATIGNTPVLSNSSTNNGIGGYCGLEPTEEGKIITFSDTTTGADTMFYQTDPFIGYSHVQGMYPYNSSVWNDKRYLYLISAIRKSAGSGWSYAVKFNRALVCELMVELPVTSEGNTNFDYMERYIRAIEKLVIADVVKYKDKVIDTTKMLVNSQF